MTSLEGAQATIQQAAGLIRESKLAIILTGAGFSTPSGIPDFRSAGSGLWTRDNPMEVASLTAFQKHPDRFFAWIRSLASSTWNAKPNPAHLALASLERAGIIKAVITQNIDGLHQLAGSVNVLELHGTLKTIHCSACRATYQTDLFIQPFIAEGIPPRCPTCQGLLKPGIVLFEEMLPQEVWRKAEQYCLRCDLIIVAGSSLEVIPASQLPLEAVRHGARLIIANRTPTYLDPFADAIFRDDLAMVIPQLTTLIL